MIRALAPLLVVLLAACQLDPYNSVSATRRDAALRDGLTGEGQSGSGDARSDAIGEGLKKDKSCVVDPKGETCDGQDNDCNGVIDDVPQGKLLSDTQNCGKCGNACVYQGAFAKCENGTCKMGDCAPGHYDLNKKPDDGCEYACLVTNGGVEACSPGEPDCACDNVDNNCDGQVDEAFDKQHDVNNCGSCGNRCIFAQAAATCVAGSCVMGACQDGFKDVDKDPKNGCEYKCPIWPPASTDLCDGVDNNCDGQVDEGFVGKPCDPFGVSGGACKSGSEACVGGNVVCQGAVGPKPETCNNIDDDCDGTVDNGFDKQSDPRYCGNCTPCKLPHAIAACVTGTCQIAVCEQGYVDANKNPADGCEYKCTPTGVEICDGLDNDCNNKIDGDDPGMAPLGANPCGSKGACAGATASCQGSKGWVCNYGPDVEFKPCTVDADCSGFALCTGGVCPGVLALEETRCDGKDNDCDGIPDDPWPNANKPCAEQGKQGICQGTGTWVCNAAGTNTECQITAPGKTATDELCNGLDDDCDGLTDEETDDAAGKGVVDAMVHVNRTVAGKSYNFYIYTYEAARPDANASENGVKTTRACSKGGVRPWASVTYTEAAAACAASGKRLCTKDEWVVACQGAAQNLYPYGASYSPSACNGLDKGIGSAQPTGSIATCVGGESGLFDMSGNVREWTTEQRGTTEPPQSTPIYVVRGGAYHTPALGLSCTFDYSLAVQNVALPAIGFRCCSNTPP